VNRLRDWAGTIVALATAGVEHWLGETAALAALAAIVAVFGGILWRRVSMLMATGGSRSCAKAYAVDQRLADYIDIMAPVSPIVVANQSSTVNAQFLAGLGQMGGISGYPIDTLDETTPGGANAAWYSNVASQLNAIITFVDTMYGEGQNKGLYPE
jgi:hypothetical protein